MKSFDVIVIGSGPGGYVSAIRCAQLGLKTAIIEKYSKMGGTCLNVGCIPSKALLESSEHFFKSQHEFSQHGIELEGVKINLNKMLERKNKIISNMNGGIDFLMKKNKITTLSGLGSFIDSNTVCITNQGKKENIKGDHIIIATGSKPFSIPAFNLDKKRIITSTQALSLSEMPKHLIIVGAGVIGLELGSVYARMGSKVSVVDVSDNVLSTMDLSLGKELKKVLSRNLGFKFYMSHKISSINNNGNNVMLKCCFRVDRGVTALP